MAPGSANKGSLLLTVRSQTDSSFGQYVCSGRCEFSGKFEIWTSRQQKRYKSVQ